MYDKVLIPTDGSEHARRGVEHGLEIAGAHDADVHVVFVVDESVHGGTPALSGYEAFLEKIEDEGTKIVDEVVDLANDRAIEATGAVLRGRPEERILGYVDNNDIDVVVMGRRGEAGAHRLGSVTDGVIREATVPVVPV